MNDIILYILLVVIAVSLVAIVYLFYKLSKKEAETNKTIIHNHIDTNKSTVVTSCQIPDDVAFDSKNLPYRTTRSDKRKVNYGKDFNAYLVKGGTLYHKKSCDKLKDKTVIVKHIYECIADKNKKPCSYCEPRAKIHEWYVEKFPDSIYVQSEQAQPAELAQAEQLTLFDGTENK